MADYLEKYNYSKSGFTLDKDDIHDRNKRFTYKNYISWGEDIHCELIDGIPYLMSAPTIWHQRIAAGLWKQLDDFLDGKQCQALIAPVDVRLFPKEDDSDKTVVQPDVLVVCDSKKLSDNLACKGAPDFIIEVISESTRGKDFGDKRMLYEKSGVREYWIVDTDRVYKYLLKSDMYREIVYKLDIDLQIDVSVLEGCTLKIPQ